jgi:hypothetical protein
VVHGHPKDRFGVVGATHMASGGGSATSYGQTQIDFFLGLAIGWPNPWGHGGGIDHPQPALHGSDGVVGRHIWVVGHPFNYFIKFLIFNYFTFYFLFKN